MSTLRAGFSETDKSALEKSNRTVLPIPKPIAERDCLFDRFGRFTGAVSLNPALSVDRIY